MNPMLSEIPTVQSDFTPLLCAYDSDTRVISQTPKNQIQETCDDQASAIVDARQAFGFMPMCMKGATIRWRGL